MSPASKTSAAEEEAKPVLVPKLRFPEFRGAEGWTSERLGEIYSFKGNNSLSRDKLNYVAGSMKNIHYGDIHTKFSSHFDITKELVPFINQSEEDVVRNGNLCAEGDMVFADASEDMTDIGKSIEIVRLSGERLVSGLHTILARPTGVRIRLGFGGHLFKCAWVRTQIQKEAQGAKVLGISANRMRNLRLPLPRSIGEQQKIAECLSSVDELIAAQARKVDALKTHKKGLMQQLFPREGETQPRLRFPEFQNAGEWEVKPLSEVTSAVFDGTHQTPTYTTSGIPFYSVENLISGNANKFISKEDYDIATKKNKPEKGDILLTRIGKIGFSQVVTWEHEFSVYVTLAVIKKSNAFDSHYMQFMMQCGRYQTDLRSKSLLNAVPPKINMDSLRATKVILPPSLTEQQRIATSLSSLDALITAETQKHEALKTHKRGLMQQLFPSPEDSSQ